ncbi:cytochrome P450 81Q32-like [Carex rostrata]
MGMDLISMNTFFSIFVLILITILVNSITKSKSKKKLLPGPRAIPILGHLHLLKTTEPLHQTLHKISNQFGPAVFLHFGSRPVLVISSNTLAEQCFTTHDLAFANRVHLPTVKMAPGLIVWVNYGTYWRTVRQAAAIELLSSQQLNASSHIRAKEFTGMARQLFTSYYESQEKSEAKSNSFIKLDFKKMLFESMMNLMLMTIAGKRAYGENNEDSDDMKKFSEALIGWFEISGASNAEDFLPLLRILDLKGTMKRMKNVTKVNQESVERLIDEHRLAGIGKRKTMINSLLELQKKDSEKYKDEAIRDIVIAMMLGGTETTSTTIEWGMAELLNSPQLLEKATAEIGTHVGNKRLIQESDMNNLPFLNCIISEIFRLHPALPLLVSHESREDIKLGNYDIAKGTMLIVNIYPIQRDPEIWEEPNKFNPNRFENGNSNGKLVIPFGMGRRRCPGETFAMRILGVLLGTLIQCFEWKRLGDELIDLTEGCGLTTPLATPLEVMYRPRLAMKELLSEF